MLYPEFFWGIPVYVATAHLIGTEETSPRCRKLPHKHYVSCISSTVHITESARF